MIRSVLLSALLAPLIWDSAGASICARITNTAEGALETAKKSELVLLARIIDETIRSQWKNGATQTSTTVTLAPVEVFKGQEESEEITVVPGIYSHFVVGNIYLVFDSRSPDMDNSLYIDSCSSIPYELDPPGADFENAKLRKDLAPILKALRANREEIE